MSKTFKKPLDKREKGRYTENPQEKGGYARERGSKNLKKLKKVLKKVLTNAKETGIIVKLSGEEMRRTGIGL